MNTALGTLRMTLRITLTACVAATGLVACGSDDSSGGSGSVTVADAWARTSAMTQTAGAVYLTITSPTDDAIVSAAVDESIAGAAQLHETMMASGDTAMSGGMSDGMSSEMNGSMMMHQVEELTLPAGEAVALKPGGYHIMLIDLVAPLTTGSFIDVTLTLKSGGTVVAKAEVREDAP